MRDFLAVGYLKTGDPLSERMQLKAMGADCKIFTDLEQAIATLRPGDRFIIWRLDYLGSLHSIIKAVQEISDRRARFIAVYDKIDTAKRTGREFITSIQKLAESQTRWLSRRIKERLPETVGRPSVLTPEMIARLEEMDRAGFSLEECAQVLHVSISTVGRAKRKIKTKIAV